MQRCVLWHLSSWSPQIKHNRAESYRSFTGCEFQSKDSFNFVMYTNVNMQTHTEKTPFSYMAMRVGSWSALKASKDAS